MGSIDTQTSKCCWVTLVTKPSYLPGAIILAYTLGQHDSKYPLIVQYTSSLGKDAIAALEAEARQRGRVIPKHVELLLPRQGQENTGSVASRFRDTFTKLRAFQSYELGFTQACFLDADVAIFRNPDEIFDIQLPGRDWLGANHACVCNLDHDSWAPSHWTKGNCAYTTVTGPDQVAASVTPDSRPTYKLLNGGMLLFHPTSELWQQMLDFFNTTDRLKTYQFPDQDFLADFFRDKWQPVSWKFNALKTMRYWHPRLWSDEDLIVLHYIVDKPWERQVSDDGVAGHLGRDGATHQWWWDAYRRWLNDRNSSEEDDVSLKVIGSLIGKEQPFTKKIPLSQEPGKLEDVLHS